MIPEYSEGAMFLPHTVRAFSLLIGLSYVLIVRLIFFLSLFKKLLLSDTVAHTCKTSIWEAKIGFYLALSSRPI